MKTILRNVILITGLIFFNNVFAEGKEKWEAPETVDGTELISLE